MLKKIIFVFTCCFFAKISLSQYCIGTTGQSPAHPYPVCGNITHHQPPLPFCYTHDLEVPCPPGYIYRDYSPFWYKITCYQAGNLGFVITPDHAIDDYDWELFDVTGKDPGNVFYGMSLAVGANFSGTLGPTGARNGGAGRRFSCASDPADNKPAFNAMPALEEGHVYLLLVILAGDLGGYTVSFEGGTADIKDPTEPHLLSAKGFCGGQTTIIKTNKKVACASLALDGSDFTINPPLATVLTAKGLDCYNNFGSDSIGLTLSNILPAGNYTVNIKSGTDGNSVMDFCNNSIADGESIPLIIDPLVPIAMDSLTKPGCLTDELRLVFSKQINCFSVAMDGSDFVITGPGTVNVITALTHCDYMDKTPDIRLKLSTPLHTPGVYQVKLVQGSDGNTLIDECGLVVPPGTVSFTIKDTVNADFSYAIHLGCKNDTINFFHTGANDVNTWQWDFDGIRNSTLQNPQILYDNFGTKHAQLIVSNGFCADTSEVKTFFLGNILKAAFEATTIICPGDPAKFKDNSVGNIVSWNWSFGNNSSSSLQAPPPQIYIPPAAITKVIAKLTVQNDIGCFNTASKDIDLYNECLVLVPNAFTPNGDGLNDYLYPLNGDKATGLLFKVFNRYGQLVFETDNFAKRWDGKFKGQPADPGVYIWILHYTDSYTHKYYERKGTTILLK